MKRKSSLIGLAAVVIVGLLASYAWSIWPHHSSSPIGVTPTQTINHANGIGGVAVHTPSAHTSNEEQPHSSSPSSPSVVTPIEDTAPRQAAITQNVRKEYPYRALRTSNDPLPQPTWASSAIRTAAAWDQATGNGVIVAVIDTGFALAHEDLASRWYQNTGETGQTVLGGRCWTGAPADKATNNCDDDNNGYRDDWRGWDFVGVNNSPQAGDTNPTGSGVAHGTEVSGLVGAAGNNGTGTATVSWNNTIMPLQALDDNGSGYTSSVTSAVYYAVDNGAKVINMSLGGDSDDAALAAAITYAYNHNVVVVAAAGNCGTGTESGCDPARPGAMGYPALNQHVIAVGATTSTNVRASFSSYGPGLDVMAPGSGTLVSPMWHSANQTSAYATSLYGTSFASPIVASYVGLIKSIRPSSSVQDVIALVDASASKPNGMAAAPYSNEYGHGILDVQAGLRVGASLNTYAGSPALAQTGSNVSEHSFTTTATLSSGCIVSAGAYCTIWAQNDLGYDRYLPYTASVDGSNAWTWPGSWLADGSWLLRARSGDNVSPTPYTLLNK